MAVNTREANNSTIQLNNASIRGDNNTIHGNNNHVVGNNNSVYGNNLSVTGNNCKVYGNNNRIKGNNNYMKGENNTAVGVNNQLRVRSITPAKTNVTNISTHGFAGNNVGGVQTMVNYGNYAANIHGTQVNSFVSSSNGGSVTIGNMTTAAVINNGIPSSTNITVGRGIGMQTSSAEGSTIVNHFGGRGMSTVVVDGGDSDSSSSSSDDSSSQSKKYHRERPSVSNNNNRSRDRSEPPSKIIYPKPWPEEPGRGIDQIPKKCRVCKTASAIVIAWPCTHTCLCVRCTLEVKPIACVGCKKDVTEFKMIEPEIE
jgi:hypothetical protein